MARRRPTLRSRLLVLASTLLASAGALHAASRGLPAATHAIALDGRFDDWAPVFAQAEQVSVDGNASLTGAGCHPTNPDRDCITISGQGRDVVRVASTWDATHVYFYVGRSSEYEKITHCAFVLDLDADGVAESTDRVLDVTWSGGGATTLKGVDLLDYVPASASGDPLACADPLLCPAPGAVGYVDGYTLRGTVGAVRWSESNVPGAAPSGDRIEVRVPWSALGVAPGTGMLWHLAVAQDGKVSSAVDNVGGAEGKAGRVGVLAVDVTPDREGMAASPGAVSYCHDIRNRGQFRDRYNVRALSTAGASVGLRLDPTGQCAAGPPDAVDANGDGDFTDPGDTRAPSALDADLDGAPDVAVPAGATSTWILTVTLPSAFHGAVDLTALEARSLERPTLTARALDTTRTGPLALGTDAARSGTAGSTVPLGPFVLRNTSGGALGVQLVAAGPAGWPLRLQADAAGSPGTLLASDLDGDGTWDGAVGAPATLSPGQVWTFWIAAGIPAGTPLDTRGDIELRAESASWPRAPGRAWATVHVRAPLELVPSHAGPSLALPGFAGGVVFFPHRLVNSQAREETVTLSGLHALPAGYTQRWYSDPNGDGNPSDGAPLTAPLKVPAHGGVIPLVSAVAVPESGAGAGAAAGTLATGAFASTSARHDVALPSILTSSDPHGALGAVRFPPCATVHARVSGLLPASVSGFVLRRRDPSGQGVDTAALVSDRYGVAWAAFPAWGGAPAGTWQLVLESNGTPVASQPYTVEAAAAVRLDVPAEAQPGEALLLDARLSWLAAAAPLEESTVRFEVRDPSLAPVASFTSPVPRLPPGTRRVTWGARPGVAFPVFGRHTAQGRWMSSCGGELAGDLRAFSVPPLPPTLTSPRGGEFLSSATPSLSGQSLPGASVSLLVDGVAVGTATGPGFSATSPPLSEGPHRWTATQALNGASSPRAPEVSFTVDTVAPQARITAPGPGVPFRSAPLFVTGTASDVTSGVARVEISVQGGAWQVVQGTTSWSWSFTPPSDGTWRLAVRAVDAAGNVEAQGPSVTVTYDATPPDTTWQSTPPVDSASAAAAFTFSATEVGVAFECSVEGAAFAPCTSPLERVDLADGWHRVEVRARDAAGNVDPSPAHHAWRVDTVAPTVTWAATPPALTASTEAVFEFGSADPGAVLQCALDRAGYLPCASPRAWQGLHDGTHQLAVRATDAAGNVGPELAWSWTVDATPPLAVLLHPLGGSAFNTAPVLIGGTATDSGAGMARVEVSVDGGPYVPATGTASWQLPFTPTREGVHQVSVRGVDVAGNVQPAPATASFLWDTMPPDTAFALAPPPLTRSSGARFELSSSEPASRFECRVDAGAWAACGGSLSLSDLGDGPHALEARALDAAGNADPSPVRTGWQVDTQAPTVIFQPLPALTASPSAEVIFTPSEPATFSCVVDGGPAFACASPVQLGGLAHGPHTLSVRGVDAAGNAGPAAELAWTVDLVPPVVTLTSRPPPFSAATSASVAFTLSEPAEAECSVDGRPWQPCASPVAWTGLFDGAHAVEVRARDAAGNTGPVAQATWTVDTLPPATSFSRTPPAVDSAPTAAFGLRSSEPGGDWLCRLDGASLATPCQDPARFEWLADGPHQLQVFARDAAGNTDPVGAAWQWTVDTSLPDTLFVGAPPPWSNQPGAVFHLGSSAEDPGYECRVDGEPWASVGPVLQVTGLADGRHTVECRSRNAAGTWDPSPALHAWSVDLQPPAAPGFSAVPPTTDLPLLSGTAEPGTTLRWTLDGHPLPDATVLPDGNFSGAPGAPLAEGSHLLEGHVVDLAGNAGPPATRAFFTDTVAPVVTVLGGPPNPTPDTHAQVAFHVEDAHPDSASCRLDGAHWVPCASPTLLEGLEDGPHLVEIRAVDEAGNVGGAASLAWRVDTTAPGLRWVEIPPALVASRQATLRMEAGGDATSFDCTLDGTPLPACAAVVQLAQLAEGPHTFTATAVDAAGNRSATLEAGWAVDVTAPLAVLEATPGTLTRDPRAAFSFHASEAPTRFTCTLDGSGPAPCSPPWIPDSLADGPHEAAFVAWDAAGNGSAEVRWAWTLDTQPPSLEVTSGPAALSSTQEAPFAFITSEAAAVSCSLDGLAESSCASPWNAGPVSEGHHVLVLHPVDGAGNEGAPVRWTWDVDVTPPLAPSLELPPAAHPQPDLLGSAEPGTRVELRLDGVLLGQVVAGPDGRFQAALPAPLADGPHLLSATAQDGAGNTGAPGTLLFVTDTQLPTAFIVRAPAAAAPSGHARFEFTADEPSTFECSLDGAALLPCPGLHEAQGLADGDHTLSVRAVDVAGNAGLPALHGWRVDTRAPEVEVHLQPGAWTRTPSARVAFTANEPSTVVGCTLDGVPLAPCPSPLELDGLPEGPHGLVLTATDEAGNTGPGARVTWTQDTLPPSVTVISAPSPLSSSTRAAVAFQPSEPGEITCSLDGAAAFPCTSPTLLDALAPGDHVLLLAATDLAGNTGPAVEVRWTVDPTAPAAPVLAPVSSTVNTPPIEGTAEPGARVVVSLDGQPVGEVEADANGHFTFELPGPLSEGTHELTAVAVDAAGNEGLPAHQPVLTDTVPPSVTITFGPPALYNQARASFRFVASETATFRCSVDGASAAPCGSAWLTAPLQDGPHHLAVVAEDVVGNQGPAATWRWDADSQVPTVQVTRRPAALERSDAATVEWTVSEPADTACALDGAGWKPCASALSLSGLSEGEHRLGLRAVDATGNRGPEAEVRWRVDTVSPETALVQHPSGLLGTGFALLSFTSEPGATFDCSLDAEPFRPCPAPAVFTSLADGPHRFEVRAVDEAGNRDGTPEAAEWEVDTRAPDTTILTGPEEGQLMGEDVTFTFSASLPDASFECSLDGAGFQPCAAAWTLQYLPTAPHALAVRAVSRAGVADPTPALRTWRTDPDALATRKIRVKGAGCGCTSSDATWAWWGLLGLAVALKRKRAVIPNRITAP